MEPKYVKRRQRGLAVLIASFVLLIGAVVWIAVQLSGNANNPQAQVNDYEGTGNGVQQLVEIPEGAALAQLGPELEERDIVASDSAFQTAAANNPAAGNIQPGFYRLEEQMSASAAVDALTNPDNQVDLLDVHGGATLMDVVVVGGETRQGIYSQIAAVSSQGSADGSGVTVQELHEVAANVDPGELGAPEWALDRVRERGNDPRRLEGLIAPGQYVVDPSKSAQEVLTDLVSRSTKLYNETNIEERAGALNLSAYDLLTAASLIEREAPAGEFDKVARVILNRLEEPMRLEFDSTVNYGLDDVEVATTDEDRAEVTPWNTYAMDGLPQTPIASPSVEAIEAMENPAEGNWLFFVTVDEDGTTVFNDTFEEHLADVQRSADSGVLDSNR
ncbi:endolytic transglycosylase MltG [Corynebacterium yudongzhengii]|uniref:Endolytic murein transglycosylase n=2 Tax=Corynebacterium yudongzhengii TaxID=2080740 RepID=A0A2U1T7Z2_9CORY|nr:endolytic transglycosylase MltG [Corynebacterium yudongzhengii]PWC02109.1 endolytic transglycosylase MltG [Corynebacterium yudongzhengii]